MRKVKGCLAKEEDIGKSWVMRIRYDELQR